MGEGGGWRRGCLFGGFVVAYPGIVEFGLEGDVFAFFFELGAEDLQFGGF